MLTVRCWTACSPAAASRTAIGLRSHWPWPAHTAIGRDELIKKATSALKIDEATALEVIAELTAMQLLEVPPGDPPSVQLTAAGRELQRKVRTDINRAISDLYSDIPSDELATAGRVLNVITDRINSELARDRPSAPDREPDTGRSL